MHKVLPGTAAAIPEQQQQSRNGSSNPGTAAAIPERQQQSRQATAAKNGNRLNDSTVPDRGGVAGRSYY